MTTLTDLEWGQVDHWFNSLYPHHHEVEARVHARLEALAAELNDVAALSMCAAAARRIAYQCP